MPLIFCSLSLAAEVRTGLDQLAAYGHLFHDKRVGIIANQTAQDRQGRFIVAVFRDLNDVTVTALYAPEHGLWGRVKAGGAVETRLHPKYGIPVFSLYGPDEKPAPPELATVDVLVFDMQDIGTRFYPYVSTMALAMQAAAQAEKPFVVLDRPNPLGGRRVEGPILNAKFASFKGMFPIPVVHGMTVGELARLINGEGWLGEGCVVDLRVIPLDGWTRDMEFEKTGLRFVKPSPNIPDPGTTLFYPCTALIEGTNVSEGRGTDKPFQQLGAPWIDGKALADTLNALAMAGVHFDPTHFTPRTSKHAGVVCRGVRLEIRNEEAFAPFTCGVQILKALFALYSEHLQWHLPHLDELCGTDVVRQTIERREPLEGLIERWRAESHDFKKMATAYYFYR